MYKVNSSRLECFISSVCLPLPHYSLWYNPIFPELARLCDAISLPIVGAGYAWSSYYRYEILPAAGADSRLIDGWLQASTLVLLVGSLANTKMMQKTWKMIETLAYGYSSESTQRELSNEYQHNRV